MDEVTAMNMRGIGRTWLALAIAAPLFTGVATAQPKDATAKCKDGTYSTAKTARGACSQHGGVDKWLGASDTKAESKAAPKELRPRGTTGRTPAAPPASSAPADATG